MDAPQAIADGSGGDLTPLERDAFTEAQQPLALSLIHI